MRSVLLLVLMLVFTNVAYARKAPPSRSAKAMFPTYYELMKLSPRVRTIYLRNLAKAIGDFERGTHGPLTKTAELELRETEELFAMMSFLPQAKAADAPGNEGVPLFRQSNPKPFLTKYSMICKDPYIWSDDIGTCVVSGTQREIYETQKSTSCPTGERVAVKGWFGQTSYCVSKDALAMVGEDRAKALRDGKASYANVAQSGEELTHNLKKSDGVMQKAMQASFGSAGGDLDKQIQLAEKLTDASDGARVGNLWNEETTERVKTAEAAKLKASDARVGKLWDEENDERVKAAEAAKLKAADAKVAKVWNEDSADKAKAAEDAKLAKQDEESFKRESGPKDTLKTAELKQQEQEGEKRILAHVQEQGNIKIQTASLQAGEDKCEAFRCNSATKSRKEQDQLREKYKATKNKSCTIGGMPSKYRNGDVRRGNCEPITQIEGFDFKCPASETICNPALYCVPKKTGADAVFCVNPKKVKGHVQVACRDKHLEAWKSNDDLSQNCVDGASFNGVKELYEKTVKTYEDLCFNPDASFRTYFCAECDMLSLRIQNANRAAFKKDCLVTMNREDKAPSAAPAPQLPEELGTGDAKAHQ